MPGVVRTTPQTFTYRTDDGEEHEVARGFIPELDYEADAFEQRMGGASASAPVVNAAIGPDPTLAAIADRNASQPVPGLPMVQAVATDAPAPGSFRDMAQGAMAIDRPQPSGGAPMMAELNAESDARRQELRPGRTFSGAQPQAAAPQNPGVLVGRRMGGGGGGPRQTMRMEQSIARPIDPVYGDRIADAEVDQMIARQEAIDVAAERAKREGQIRGQAERDQAAAMQGRQRAQEQYQRRVEEQQARIDQDIQRYQQIAEDPHAGKGTGARLMAALSVALVGLGDAIAGKSGPNSAVQMLQEQWAAEREAAREKIRSGQGKLAELRDMYGSEQAALDVHEAGLRRRFADQIEGVAAGIADQELAARFREVAAQESLAAAQQAAAAAQQAAGVGTITTEQRSGGGRGGPGQQVIVDPRTGVELTVAQAIELGLIEKVPGQGDEQRPLPRIPGLAVADPEAARQLSPTDVSQVRRMQAGLESARDAVRDLRGLREEFGAGDWIASQTGIETGTVRGIRQQSARLMRAISVLEEAGALGDQEREYYQQQIGDITAAGPGASQSLAAIAERIESEATSRLRGYGFRLEDVPQTAGAPVVGR